VSLPDQTLTYAAHDDGVVDLHLPAGPARGTVLLLHGGFWRSRYDRTHTRPMAAALAEAGWLVATPEYRRAGAGGGWPMTFDDVSAALDLAVSSEPGPYLVVGHSAGGHLALWLAARGRPVDRVVALAPVGDLRHAAEHGVGGSALSDFLGGPLAEADPSRLLAASPPAFPVVILHGDQDDDVPIGNSRWADSVPGVELRELPDVDHMSLISPRTEGFSHTLAALES
jgi:acetyl esterase/lipase